jgi:hypothetical protein
MTMADAKAGFGNLGGSWKQHEKQTRRAKRILHGKQGQGRFRAFAVCENLSWQSTYAGDDGLREFTMPVIVPRSHVSHHAMTITGETP